MWKLNAFVLFGACSQVLSMNATTQHPVTPTTTATTKATPTQPYIMEHRIYYYPMVPYIYEEDNQTKGMLKEIVENAMVYCVERAHGYKVRFHWYRRFHNYSDYISFIESPFYDKAHERIPEYNQSLGEYLWLGPFMSLEAHVAPGKEYQWVNRGFQLAVSPGAYVIVGKSRVSWVGKLVEGIKNCQNYLALAILLCMCAGMLVYLIESRYDQNEFGRSISDGAWNGLWWAFVTMSTIGYGDIVPHSRTGRMISLLWLAFGVIMGSIITATFTDAMSSNTISISGQKVAVLRHSWEKIITEAHGGIQIEMDSYEEVLQAVRDGECAAAVVNSDYVQWHQQDIQKQYKETSLAIGYFIDITIPIRMNVLLTGNIAEIWTCLDRFRNDITDIPQRKYFRYVDVAKTHKVTLREMLYDNDHGFSLVVATILIILVAFLWSMLEKFYFKKKTNFGEAWKFLRRNNNTQKEKTKENAHNYDSHNNNNNRRVSALTNEYQSKQNGGLLNPSFQHTYFSNSTQENNNSRGLNERLHKMETDLELIKNSIGKLAGHESERKKSFSQFLAS